ncbi:predicted protein [Postia placenta Mad-698-R]|uniref:Uncharacterized protein n=1 Tax=Postia placenta MAD-698-R-SB12 TaxID=670580 RepID=A0A1X6MLT3_9APHY|nr:hypothetical protein POSPLADRAFT_1050306 [Postia placenta MAD-698-R-SB12]EED82247.1 predicted protein [Postia placenta Mad-698-R]OSX57298.1 hypothetical protein POSPLADRAFT_1050306 [Postia placenta MAD-698-R-SB12]
MTEPQEVESLSARLCQSPRKDDHERWSGCLFRLSGEEEEEEEEAAGAGVCVGEGVCACAAIEDIGRKTKGVRGEGNPALEVVLAGGRGAGSSEKRRETVRGSGYGRRWGRGDMISSQTLGVSPRPASFADYLSRPVRPLLPPALSLPTFQAPPSILRRRAHSAARTQPTGSYATCSECDYL